MKLGIYVGSFNPPHNGHIKVANFLIENKIVDKVIILPTPNYWDKQDLVDINMRIDMLKLLETDNIIIDNKHNNYPYTYQVFESLKKDYNDTLYLIIGSDNLEKFHLWKNVDEILKNYVIVLRRGNTEIDNYLEKFDRSKFIVIDDFPFIDVSSTKIREGSDDNLDPKVLQYIRENKLYGRK